MPGCGLSGRRHGSLLVDSRRISRRAFTPDNETETCASGYVVVVLRGPMIGTFGVRERTTSSARTTSPVRARSPCVEITLPFLSPSELLELVSRRKCHWCCRASAAGQSTARDRPWPCQPSDCRNSRPGSGKYLCQVARCQTGTSLVLPYEVAPDMSLSTIMCSHCHYWFRGLCRVRPELRAPSRKPSVPCALGARRRLTRSACV